VNHLTTFDAYLAACFRRWEVAEQDINDLVQDTFLRALTSACEYGNYDVMPADQLRRLLARIARNHFLNTSKRATRLRILKQAYAEETDRASATITSPVEIAATNEAGVRVKAMIGLLPVRERHVISQRLENRSHKQIAKELGVPVARVQQVEAQAMWNLKQLMMPMLD